MAKVLVIRKPDRTIHKVPLANKAVLMNYNLRRPNAEKWKFEEMDEDEANKLPFIDDSYITAAEAQNKVKELEVTNNQKDNRIAELERMLAAKESQKKEANKPGPAAPTSPDSVFPLTTDNINDPLTDDSKVNDQSKQEGDKKIKPPAGK